MAELENKELERIVRRDMPGYRLAQSEKNLADDRTTGAEVTPDAVSPDLETLYRKYFGSAAAEDVAGYADNRPTAAGRIERTLDADTERIVTVEPEYPRDPLDRGARAKAVIVSTEQKRVIGFQG